MAAYVIYLSLSPGCLRGKWSPCAMLTAIRGKSRRLAGGFVKTELFGRYGRCFQYERGSAA
jgi:hypothetical protein